MKWSKRFAVFMLVAPCAFVAAACGGTSGSDAGDAGGDAGPTSDLGPGADAADAGSGPDGRVGDGSSGLDAADVQDGATGDGAALDAGPADAPGDAVLPNDAGDAGNAADVVVDTGPPPPVTVTVTLNDVPVANAPVVFNDALGAVLNSANTDASGQVSATVADGAMVTLVDVDSSGNATLYTLMGVSPGDHIAFPLTAGIRGVNNVANVDVNFGTVPDATSLIIHSGCGAYGVPPTSTMVNFQLDDSCLDQHGNLSFMGNAVDANNDVLAWTFAADLPVSTTTVTLPAWQLVTQPTTFTFSGLTEDPSYIDVYATQVLRGSARGWWPLSPGVSGTGVAEISKSLPVAGGDGFVFRATASLPSAGMLQRGYQFRNRIAPTTTDGTTWAEDLSADPLAIASDVGIDVPSSGQPTVHFATAGSLAHADGFSVYMDYAAGANTCHWNIFLPPDQLSPVPLPALPAPLDVWTPTNAAAVSPAFDVVDVEDPIDPAVFRAQRTLWHLRLTDAASLRDTTPYRVRAGTAYIGSP